MQCMPYVLSIPRARWPGRGPGTDPSPRAFVGSTLFLRRSLPRGTSFLVVPPISNVGSDRSRTRQGMQEGWVSLDPGGCPRWMVLVEVTKVFAKTLEVGVVPPGMFVWMDPSSPSPFWVSTDHPRPARLVGQPLRLLPSFPLLLGWKRVVEVGRGFLDGPIGIGGERWVDTRWDRVASHHPCCNPTPNPERGGEGRTHG
eukprot:scaffold499_cov335-Pavlova_lutheri.AAC.32